MARHGFELQGTGGNCTALVRVSPDGEIEELITLQQESAAPEAITDLVHVSTNNRIDGVQDDHPTPARMCEIVAALEDPSEEYALLDLRLQNGIGQRVIPSAWRVRR
jgi:hypothetical protein